nr:MAG TPA: hypothetical protein [Caudoviricetes sp.]
MWQPPFYFDLQGGLSFAYRCRRRRQAGVQYCRALIE